MHEIEVCFNPKTPPQACVIPVNIQFNDTLNVGVLLLRESCQSEKLQNFIWWNKKATTEGCQRKASSRYNFQNVTGYEMLYFLDPWFRTSDHTFRIPLYKQAWFDDILCTVCFELSSDQVSRKVMFSNFCNAAHTHEYKWRDIRIWHDVFQFKDLERK